MAARERVETPPLGTKLEYLSWPRSGDERRLFCLRSQWSNLTWFVDFTSIMPTFREVRDLAVACFEDIIDEEEFLLFLRRLQPI